MHNLRNAVGALGAVLALEAPIEPALEALAEYRGVGRRFERLGERGGVSWWTTTRTIPRSWWPRWRRLGRHFPAGVWWRCFSRICTPGPRSTARPWASALAAADLVDRHRDLRARGRRRLPGSAAARWPTRRAKAGAGSCSSPTARRWAGECWPRCSPGDVLITLGAGDITQLGPELAGWLSAA